MKSFLASVIVLSLCASAFADITLPKQDNPVTKFGRGVANIVAAPAHLIDATYANLETEGSTYAFTTGLAYGVWRMGADVAHGTFDLITFPLPVGPDFSYQTWKQPPFDSMVVREYPPADLTAHYIY